MSGIWNHLLFGPAGTPVPPGVDPVNTLWAVSTRPSSSTLGTRFTALDADLFTHTDTFLTPFVAFNARCIDWDGANTFVAAGSTNSQGFTQLTGKMMVSTDLGATWQNVTTPITRVWEDVSYIPASGVWIATSSSSAGCIRSVDGITWENISTVLQTETGNLVNGGNEHRVVNNRFYTVANNLAWTEDGGDTWGVADLPFAADRFAIGGGYFVAAKNSQVANNFMWSKDLITWTAYTLPFTIVPTSILYDPDTDYWVIVDALTKVARCKNSLLESNGWEAWGTGSGQFLSLEHHRGPNGNDGAGLVCGAYAGGYLTVYQIDAAATPPTFNQLFINPNYVNTFPMGDNSITGHISDFYGPGHYMVSFMTDAPERCVLKWMPEPDFASLSMLYTERTEPSNLAGGLGFNGTGCDWDGGKNVVLVGSNSKEGTAEQGAIIRHSSDHGQTFTEVFRENTGGRFNHVVYSEKYGVFTAVGLTRKNYYSTDGGATWTNNPANSFSCFDICITPSGRIGMVNTTFFYYSDDGGITWSAMSLPSTQYRAITFNSATNTWWVMESVLNASNPTRFAWINDSLLATGSWTITSTVNSLIGYTSVRNFHYNPRLDKFVASNAAGYWARSTTNDPAGTWEWWTDATAGADPKLYHRYHHTQDRIVTWSYKTYMRLYVVDMSGASPVFNQMLDSDPVAPDDNGSLIQATRAAGQGALSYYGCWEK